MDCPLQKPLKSNQAFVPKGKNRAEKRPDVPAVRQPFRAESLSNLRSDRDYARSDLRFVNLLKLFVGAPLKTTHWDASLMGNQETAALGKVLCHKTLYRRLYLRKSFPLITFEYVEKDL
jgi:hypothetical protein